MVECLANRNPQRIAGRLSVQSVNPTLGLVLSGAVPTVERNLRIPRLISRFKRSTYPLAYGLSGIMTRNLMPRY